MVKACCQMLTDLLVLVSSRMYWPQESCGELGMTSLQEKGYSSQKNNVNWHRDMINASCGWLYNITIYRKLFPHQLVSPDLEPLKKNPTLCQKIYYCHPLGKRASVDKNYHTPARTPLTPRDISRTPLQPLPPLSTLLWTSRVLLMAISLCPSDTNL